MTKKDSNIIVRIDAGRKEAFNEICESMDVNISSAIIGYIDSVIVRKKIPINIYASIRRNLPHKETLNIILIKKIVGEAIDKMKKHNIKKVYLFGSYSRGEQTNKSDIDLLIDTDDDFTLFDQAEFLENVKDETQKEVDVLTSGGLSTNFYNSIRKDLICLYER